MTHPLFRLRPAALALLSAGLLAACAGTLDPPPVPRIAFLTSGAVIASGKRTHVAVFKTDDIVVQLVTFTWSPSTVAEQHDFAWNWYRNDQLVIHQERKKMQNLRSPLTLGGREPADLLGPGHYKVETLLDGRVVASNQFDVMN